MFSNRRISGQRIRCQSTQCSIGWTSISSRIWECRGQVRVSESEQLLRIVLSNSPTIHFASPKPEVERAAACATAAARGGSAPLLHTRICCIFCRSLPRKNLPGDDKTCRAPPGRILSEAHPHQYFQFQLFPRIRCVRFQQVGHRAVARE